MGILRVNQVSGDETQLSTLGIGTTAPVTGSVLFDGNTDKLSCTLPALIGPFTIEGWWYATAFASTPVFFGNWDGTGCLLRIAGSNIQWYTSGLSSGISATYTFITGQWYHLAVSRDTNNVHRVFVNGVQVTSATDSTTIPMTNQFNIGAERTTSTTNDIWTGYISNFRILKGTALYTANFTPPTLILEPIQDTILLCCNNPDSAAAVSLAGIGTGISITVTGDAVASTFNPGLVRNFTSGTQFTGVAKIDTQGYFVPPSGTTTQRSRGRGVFGGGDPGATNNISFIEIQSTGNAQDFGDLTQGRLGAGGFSSSTRGVFSSGYNATNVNTIDYITISTTSNAVDFGDSTEARHEPGACSSSTRGVVGGGVNPGNSNVVDYITISSLGNALDFGDLTVARRNITSAQSPTRGIFFGGRVDPAATHQNVIDYITFATIGNAIDFGDLITTRARAESVSNSTRAVCIGGENPTAVTTMEYVTMSSTGNSVNFGTCSSGANNANNGASNSVRGVFHSASGNANTLDYITIAATGNTTDFGDLNYAQTRTTAFSDSHGGIS